MRKYDFTIEAEFNVGPGDTVRVSGTRVSDGDYEVEAFDPVTGTVRVRRLSMWRRLCRRVRSWL